MNHHHTAMERAAARASKASAVALLLCLGTAAAQAPAPPPPPVPSPPPAPMIVSPAPPAPMMLPPAPTITSQQQQALPLRQAFFPSLRTLGPDEGIVSFALATNDARGRMPDTVTLVGARERFEVRPVSEGHGQNLGVYTAVLPAGRYHFMRIDDRIAFRWITFNPVAQSMLGDFEVVAGRSANLGTVVLSPFVGSYALTRQATTDVDLPALLQRMAPQSAARAGTLPAGGGWRREPFRAGLDAVLQGMPVGLPVLRELADGRLVGPSSMGQLVVRSPAGEWRTYRSGSPLPLVWAAAGDQGELLAVSDDGRMVAFGAEGAPRDVPLQGLPQGRLIYVGGSATDGWFLAVEVPKALVLLRAARLDATAWEEVGRVARTESVWSGNRGAWVFDVPTGIVLVQGSQGLIRHYRYASRTWEDNHTPGNRDINILDPMPDGSVSILTIAAGGFAGAFSGAYISPDLGKTWREVNTGYTVKVSPIAVPGDGRLLQVGGVFGEAGIKQSRDDGKTWTQLTEALPPDAHLVMTRNHGLLAVRRLFEVHDVVLRSPDGGATWVWDWSGLARTTVERVLSSEQAERDAKAAKRAAARKKKG